MAGEKMRIHAYRIQKSDESTPLEEVLDLISADGIEERERSVSYSQVRLDHVEREPVDGHYLMDFVLRRYEGPGRSRIDSPNQDFRLSETDRFGEETAALYDPATQRLVMQYNHRGVKIGRAVEYFSIYRHAAEDSFNPLFEIDPAFRARLAAHRTVPRGVIVAIAPGELTEDDRAQDISLRTAREIHDRTGANHVKMEISAHGYDNERLTDHAWTSLQRLWALATRRPEVIPTLKYRGKTDPDVAAEVLDLLNKRLETQTGPLPINEGRRIAQDTRFRALQRAWNEWREYFQADDPD